SEADRARLLEALLAPVEADEDDRALATQLLAERSPEDIAAALVRSHRAKLPAAEELLDAGERPAPSGPRAGFEDTVWFRMDIGRRHSADPRWLLPLLCRRGHITRQEIGAIRIAAGETWFEIPRAAAQRFWAAVRRTADAESDGEAGVQIEPVPGRPRDIARENRGARPGGPPPRPHRGRPR
ncbi:MAG: DbpA RNA binding domain-containing protein, partial [Alphaproteobacteria bacterium]|nr:DbpA RNA binding domain-containing protein [Alphaproteobacteria bacterium]